MKVNWNIAENQSPVLFSSKAAWSGLTVQHSCIMPGSMPEYAPLTHELNVALAGKLTTEKLSAAGKLKRTSGGAGSICLTPAGQPIAASWENQYEYLALSLTPAFVAQTALEINFTSRVEFLEIYRTEDPLIQHIGLALLAEVRAPQFAGKLYAESLAQTLVLHLLKNYTTAGAAPEFSSGGLSGYKMRRVNEFINAHLEDDLSLAEIAAAADLSQFHFARAFRRTTGLTPQQYVVQKRIERAKQLLTAGDLPLVEIGLRVGFKNQSHFTTLFRKLTALTPKAWRELKHS